LCAAGRSHIQQQVDAVLRSPAVRLVDFNTSTSQLYLKC
jgi:hypothetical protein